MKKICFLCILLLQQCLVNAQTFSVQYDTVYINYVGETYGTNGIIVPLSAGNVRLKWSVTACDFPSDWLDGTTGFCDNNACYVFSNIWPAISLNPTYIYSTGTVDGLSYLINLASAVTTGTHYITLTLFNQAIPSDIATETYIIQYEPSGNQYYRKLTIFPNPAGDIINVHCNNSDASQNLSISNTLGQVLISKQTTGSHNTIDVSNLPSGIYFIRVVDKHNTVIAVDKFGNVIDKGSSNSYLFSIFA